MLYPVIFEPIYKEMIWGGKQLKTFFSRDIPFEKTGESWDISCREKENGIVANGKHKGKTFSEYIKINPKDILGETIYKEEVFPLLVKIISAEDNLSVQVHPNNKYAMEAENYIFGKKEMWYILKAPENATLIAGLKAKTTREIYKKAIEEGNSGEFLEKIPVSEGDIINIPEGLIHAITKGIVLAEVQQNSDITYRVYDYNRKDKDGNFRELHVEKALDVINFSKVTPKVKGLNIKEGENLKTYYIANDCFTIIEYSIKNILEENSDEAKFYIFTCVKGNCSIKTKNANLDIKEGTSFFIPAKLGKFTIEGNCKLLKSFVGDVEKDFKEPLINYGYSVEKIEEYLKL